jgi:hypothetical protein
MDSSTKLALHSRSLHGTRKDAAAGAITKLHAPTTTADLRPMWRIAVWLRFRDLKPNHTAMPTDPAA